jgi:hypothetical protein
MAYTSIDNPALYFQTKLYTGNATDDTAITFDVTDTSMQPDLIWIKNRSTTDSHHLVSVPGTGVAKRLRTDTTAAIGDQDDGVKSIQSNGFTIGTTGSLNGSGNSIVAWCWAAGGSASSNSDGDITSSVSANTTAGCSIGTFTKGSGTQTVGHGLGKKPTMFWVKRTDGTGSWYVYHDKNTDAPETDYLRLNSTDATADNSTVWGDTAPTSSVFSISTAFNSSEELVFYAFTDIKGYSKFGSYTGNGNDDGAFIYTGFKPAWVMTRQTNGANYWHIHDNKRNTFNVVGKFLFANDSSAESEPSGGENSRDFLSNGFKFRNADHNNQAHSYIYMAFAESPFVNSNGVPTNAR